jgi:small subunit ribosomal protein S4
MGKKRLRKQFEKPKKLWDKQRIEKEKKLREEYGLKNARELWRMQTELRKMRREARELLSGKGSDIEKRKQQLVGRAKKFLIRRAEVSLDDILALDIRDILERRLQTIVVRKKMASTARQARQFIVHGHIAVDGAKIASPSYLVEFGVEEKIGWFNKPIETGGKGGSSE